ncbi:uncharacterized protein HD556DRAFT_1450938 [Suillus plorans]|uniref:Uncharacterized protein n=1 Tax=Suillus plorans TaxID=116603 RepID=A0A9P7AA11_9AGAM|nr:uncharacterized protein HD556DRAFT_1450938 [Suillus plorans]KAG1785184.1 hypothetical protein HD556DRAFT_1450938 [Suillus plorans]
MHDIVFIIFQMVYALIIQEGSGGLGAFAALSTTSSTISEAVLQLLWKKLTSMEPLIYLLPHDLIQEYESSDGVLKWRFLRTPQQSDLERFQSYARRVKMICAVDGKALQSRHIHVFQTLAALHDRIRSAGSLLPYLYHIELMDKSDCLIQYLDRLLLPGLQTLILPPHMILPPDVQTLLPHLQNLVYISDAFHTSMILNSLSNCTFMHRLTLSYIQCSLMASLASLHQLISLTLIIIPGTSIMRKTSSISNHSIRMEVLNIQVEPNLHSSNVSVNIGFPAIISLLSNHHIICQGLSINIHQEYCFANLILHFFNILTSLPSVDDDDDGFLA